MAEAAATEQAPAAAAPAPGGGSKLLVALLLAIVLSGGVGVGVYFFMQSSAQSSADDEDDAGAEEESAEDGKPSKKKGKKGKKGKKSEPKLPAIFVPFDPPFVANFESDGELRFLQVQVEVLTRDPTIAESIKTQTPVIRNELLLLFGSLTVNKINTREGKERVRQDALESIRRILTEEGVKGEKVEAVYFTSFVMQ